MKLTTVLFDLDGTLLPMNQDNFIAAYFKALVKSLSARDFDEAELTKVIWTGTSAMIRNDGTRTNEELFWSIFESKYGEGSRERFEPYFNEFYYNEFDKVKESCGYDARAAITVKKIKSLGLRTVLATNPVFPAVATEKRMGWCGLCPADFELFTSYENSRYCKPSVEYYKDILARLGIVGEECLMVGNDATEDMVAEKLGMRTFLMTDCLINSAQRDISQYPQGDFDDLMRYIEALV